MTPPKIGECRANTWNIHFSDAEGIYCTGQIVENVLIGAEKFFGPKDLQLIYHSHFWGKAVFVNQGETISEIIDKGGYF